MKRVTGAKAAADLLSDLPAMMRSFRAVRGLTQDEAAKQAGINRATWARVEAGAGMHLTQAVKILDWLGR